MKLKNSIKQSMLKGTLLIPEITKNISDFV